MRKLFFLVVFVLSTFSLFQQEKKTFRIDSVPASESTSRSYGIKLPGEWKYHKGDDPVWASPAFRDSGWKLMPTEMNLDSLGEAVFETIGWFRQWIDVDSSLINVPLGLMVEQSGASEFYLDGKLISNFGTIDPADPTKEEHYNPKNIPVNLSFKDGTRHLLAVRYANNVALGHAKHGIMDYCGFTARIGRLRDAILFSYHGHVIFTAFYIFYFTFFLALSFVHLMLFLYYKANRSNLFYSIFSASFSLLFLFNTFMIDHTDPDLTRQIGYYHSFLPDIYIPALLAMLYSIFNNNRLPKLFWFILPLFALDFILTIFHVTVPYLGIVFNCIVIIEPFRIIIAAIFKKRDGAWIIGTGIISTIVFFILFFTLPFFTSFTYLTSGPVISMLVGIFTIYFTLNIPLSMTIYLARDFAKTSKSLEKKLAEVETLSARNLEQEKEKQKILETQKEVLERKVTERTSEISEQKKIIEEKNKDITDSIMYAKRIQEAMLPPLSFVHDYLPGSFVLYIPKDIVAGDFYWAEIVQMHAGRSAATGQSVIEEPSGRSGAVTSGAAEKLIFVGAADCTGHGVPGAMVSVVCANALNRAVKEFGITEPGIILDKVRTLVLETFEKSKAEVKDGMDISLCSIHRPADAEQITVKWAGANNPLWYVKNGEVREITAHKQSIGKTDNPSPFPTHTIELSQGDSLFLFTDGYADQFGGAKGKKFKYRQLQELLVSAHDLPPEQLREKLYAVFKEWKGALEQIDDVTIIGIKL